MSLLSLLLAIAAFVIARGAAKLARDLSARIERVESQVTARAPAAAPDAAAVVQPSALTSNAPVAAAVTPAIPGATDAPLPPHAPTPDTDPTPRAPLEPSWTTRLVVWIQEDWLMKLGALLLVLGFLWLTTYAFLNNWIGPAGRITLGLASGAAFLALGWHRTGRSVPQGGVSCSGFRGHHLTVFFTETEVSDGGTTAVQPRV